MGEERSSFNQAFSHGLRVHGCCDVMYVPACTSWNFLLPVYFACRREAIGHMDMQEVIRRAEDMVTEHMAKQVSLRSKGRLKLMADKV